MKKLTLTLAAMAAITTSANAIDLGGINKYSGRAYNAKVTNQGIQYNDGALGVGTSGNPLSTLSNPGIPNLA